MMDEMVGFMVSMLLGTGLAFELPVILGVLGWMGLMTARALWRFNRFALILSAVVGGIITPSPDVLSQLLMAGPLFGLFNLSIRDRLDDRTRAEEKARGARERDRRRPDPVAARVSVEKNRCENLTALAERPRWQDGRSFHAGRIF